MKKAVFFILMVLLFACSSEDGGSSNPGEEPGPGNSSGSGNGGGGGNGGSSDIGANAVLAGNKNTSRVKEMYDQWISTYYVTFEDDGADPAFAAPAASGSARIKAAFDGGDNKGSYTCSEAIGYGMLLTSLMEDWDRFDKLLKYSKAFPVKKDVALMKWKIKGFETGSGGSATDADIDILASLLIAYKKTNKQEYLDDALNIGSGIYDLEVEPNSKLLLPAMNTDALLKNGFFYNISYMSLAAFKTLAKYDQNHDWNAVLEANLSYMERVQKGGDGLWPDWSDESGEPINPDNGSSNALTASDGSKVYSHEAYYKETPRIPWRVAWYYHWYGDSRAKAMLDKGFEFLKSKGVSTCNVSTCDLKDFYSYKGGKQSSGNAAIVRWSSLCALGMGSSANQGWIDGCNEKALDFYNPALNTYYASSLQLIYAMLFNGEF